MRYFRFVCGLLLVFVVLPALSDPAAQPLSPRLRFYLGRMAEQQGLARMNGVENLLPVFIHKPAEVSLEDLGKFGGIWGQDFGEVCSALLSPRTLAELLSAHAGNIRYVELASRATPDLDASVPAIRADAVHRGDPPLPQAFTGKGVVVGIIDTGIDPYHPDFQHADGSSRILYIWDQTIPGKFPSGFQYGSEWTKAEIDANLCNQKDENGHGTHVAGIAAGNGRANPSLIGVAPDADLIIVKTDFLFTHIVDGIEYIFQKAGNRPAVVNLSLSSQEGPHDGTETPAKLIDQLVGPGRIVVVSASNSGDERVHIRHSASTGTTFGARFEVKNSTVEMAELDIWYEDPGVLSFAVGAFDAGGNWIGQTAFVGPGQVVSNVSLKQGSTTYGVITIDAQETSSHLNGARHVYVAVSSQNGTYDITSSRVTWALLWQGSGLFDAWIFSKHTEFQAFSGTQGGIEWVAGDSLMTVAIPAVAHSAIAVGSFVTKTQWTAADGNTYQIAAENGARSAFSSMGPTRDGRIKPEILAPGQVIGAPLSADAANLAKNTALVLNGGKSVIMQGTSMAAPHVTGLIALMLEAKPDLTPTEALEILKSTAKQDAFTGAVPNNASGYGKIDALGAVAAVLSISGAQDVPEPPVDAELVDPYPNPFRPAQNGVLRVYLPAVRGPLQLSIVNLLGQRVLVRSFSAGRLPRMFLWNGRDARGQKLPTGMYWVVLSSGERHWARRIALLR